MGEKFGSKKSLQKLFEIDGLKEAAAYTKSEENQKNCKPFKQLNQKYILLYKQYANAFHELSKDMESKVCRREYAKGGECIHRGVHSPSRMDLVAGGMNRGRLLRRQPKENNYNYEYLFDKQDKLICVYRYDLYGETPKLAGTELFVYKEDVVLSFEFDYTEWCGYSLMCMSECQYENGKLTRYERVLCSFLGVIGKDCTEINVETFEYADGLLQALYWYRYMPSIQILDQHKYTFVRDEEGYLSTYTAEQIGGFKPKTEFDLGSIIYKVRPKQK